MFVNVVFRAKRESRPAYTCWKALPLFGKSSVVVIKPEQMRNQQIFNNIQPIPKYTAEHRTVSMFNACCSQSKDIPTLTAADCSSM